jgi:hydroxymethylpyrimidine pyrophosphatase-like HAD family hydrolase
VQEAIAALQSAGAKWLINTGRDLPGLMEALARARLPIKPDYLAVVEREIYLHDGARYVSHQEWNDACIIAQREAFGRLRPDLPKLFRWVTDRFAATVYEDPYSPFCIIAENNDDANRIVAHLDDYCRKNPGLAIVRNDVYARFSHSGYHKGTVMSEVARLLEAPPETVLAAGDHFNDLPMLDRARARCLVAPANAIPEVIEAVRRQGGFVSTLSCGHGVAEGIHHFAVGDEPLSMQH